jgi:hypothetical protein
LVGFEWLNSLNYDLENVNIEAKNQSFIDANRVIVSMTRNYEEEYIYVFNDEDLCLFTDLPY